MKLQKRKENPEKNGKYINICMEKTAEQGKRTNILTLSNVIKKIQEKNRCKTCTRRGIKLIMKIKEEKKKVRKTATSTKKK